MESNEKLKEIIEKSNYKNHITFDSNNEKLEIQEPNQVLFIRFEELHRLIDFIRTKLSKDIRIIVKSEINFDSKKIINELNLSKCKFEKDVIFTNCTFNKNVDFRECDFRERVSFKKSVFKDKTRFHLAVFDKSASFENTTFESLVDFYCADFMDTQIFFLTDFLDITIFSNVSFHRQIQFLYNKVGEKSFVSFENAVFQESLDISRSNFWCQLQVWGLSTTVVPQEQWLYETDNIEESEIDTNYFALMRIRESYRRIKQELRSEGNNIEALKFHKYEMNIYRLEIKNRQSKNLIEDRITLWFNRLSNNFGFSWSRALLFTLITTFIFYTLFLFSISDHLIFDVSLNSIGNTLKYFIQFLNITSWDYEPFGVSEYIWGYIILYIGRLFIGYGYYQVIQAFRKYGKN